MCKADSVMSVGRARTARCVGALTNCIRYRRELPGCQSNFAQGTDFVNIICVISRYKVIVV